MFQGDEQSVTISILVSPKARTSGIVGIHAGRIRVLVRAAPQGGEANAEVIEIFAQLCNVPKRSVEVLRGAHSRMKVVRISSEEPARIRSAIEKRLSEL